MPTKIKATVKKGQLDTTIRLLYYLRMPVLVINDAKEAFESHRTRARITRDVKTTVASILPQGRTGRLLRSFMTAPVKGEIQPQIVVFSDIETAPSKAGEHPGEFSYAAFFERPEFKTFLRPAERWHIPFFGELSHTCMGLGLEEGRRAVVFEIGRRMPYSKS